MRRACHGPPGAPSPWRSRRCACPRGLRFLQQGWPADWSPPVTPAMDMKLRQRCGRGGNLTLAMSYGGPRLQMCTHDEPLGNRRLQEDFAGLHQSVRWLVRTPKMRSMLVPLSCSSCGARSCSSGARCRARSAESASCRSLSSTKTRFWPLERFMACCQIDTNCISIRAIDRSVCDEIRGWLVSRALITFSRCHMSHTSRAPKRARRLRLVSADASCAR